MIATASGWLSRSPRSRRRARHVGRDVDEQAFLLVLGEEHRLPPGCARMAIVPPARYAPVTPPG